MRQMRINKPSPPLVMEWGHCKPVGDASWREFSYPRSLCLRLSRYCSACWMGPNDGEGYC
jgi:hypothetical protein